MTHTRIVCILGLGDKRKPDRYDRVHYSRQSRTTKLATRLPLLLYLDESLQAGGTASLLAVCTRESSDYWHGQGELRKALDEYGYGGLPEDSVKFFEAPDQADPASANEFLRVLLDCLSPTQQVGERKAPDRILLDVTHGFRSQGLLATAAIERKIDAAQRGGEIIDLHVLYAAYEARKLVEGRETAPIWDLTSLVLQHRWSAAIAAFRRYARADDLEALCKHLRKKLYVSGDADGAKVAGELGKQAKALADCIATCRLPHLLTDVAGRFVQAVEAAGPVLEVEATGLGRDLDDMRDLARPLVAAQPISWQGVRAGFATARFALDTERFAECAAILRESLVSAFSCYVSTNQELPQPKSGSPEFATWRAQQEDQLRRTGGGSSTPLGRLRSLFMDCGNLRNDVQHAGVNHEPREASRIRSELDDKLRRAEELLPAQPAALTSGPLGGATGHMGDTFVRAHG